ncbi:50S ribosomal protein L9 [Spirochaeta africana]|uniref:Large ribosomal subunit protein bL9 n=1 Tax=Spirochaeta africana (strain ATCC 700263 / DSM 8902 / Z-7692) TaxID=889378 RepID=H9UKK2_SPIAZ|nr:50S ribosomal protein L9 [Spirochaeta africana]AFG38045.1 ribosomal protein L9 [Spirochaeta africana DSM 8902]
MKVILNTDVPHLGEEGDVKDVKSGYARNFLIPRKLGLPFNSASLAVIESRREAIEKRKEEKRKAAQGLKERLESAPLKISMTTGRNGKLFGSVNSATIVTELAKQGIEIERKAVEIPGSSLKTVGNFKVGVKLYGGEMAQLTVAVSSSKIVAETEEKPAAPAAEEAPAADEAEVSAEADETADAAEAAVAEDTDESEQDSDHVE